MLQREEAAGGHSRVQVLFGHGELVPLQRLRHLESLQERVRDGIGPCGSGGKKIGLPNSSKRRHFRRRFRQRGGAGAVFGLPGQERRRLPGILQLEEFRLHGGADLQAGVPALQAVLIDARHQRGLPEVRWRPAGSSKSAAVWMEGEEGVERQ